MYQKRILPHFNIPSTFSPQASSPLERYRWRKFFTPCYLSSFFSLSARGPTRRRNSTGLAELWGGWPIELVLPCWDQPSYRWDKLLASNKNLIWREGVLLRTTHAQNSRRSIRHNEPLRPPSYHGRHGAPFWLRGIETSANMSYNKAASLKLELIIFMVPISLFSATTTTTPA